MTTRSIITEYQAHKILTTFQLHLIREANSTKMNHVNYDLEAALKDFEKEDLKKVTVTTFESLSPECHNLRDLSNFLKEQIARQTSLTLFKYKGQFHLACTGFPEDCEYQVAYLGKDA